MVKQYIQSSVLRERLYAGLVGPYVDEFAKWHFEKGFKPISIEVDLRSLAAWAELVPKIVRV